MESAVHRKIILSCIGIVLESNRYAAAEYAYNNLRGMSYAALAVRDSTYALNCATLVWRAYNSGVGTTLGYSGSTVLPRNLAEGPGNMTIKIHANWSGTAW